MPRESKPLKDPFIEAQIEASLKPYVGLAPPSVLAAMRLTLEKALLTHPVAVGLTKQLREQAAPYQSTEILRDGVDTDEDKSGGQGGA
jgi:hypothetical protein